MKTLPILLTKTLILALTFSLNCSDSGDEESEDEVDTSSQIGTSQATSSTSGTSSATAEFPGVGAIALDALGATSLALAGSECAQSDNLGVFGIALGSACHTAPLAARSLLGSTSGDHNNDGVTDCSDLTYAKANNIEPGILQHLLCGDIFQTTSDITALGFDADGAVMAITFANITGSPSTGVGSWTATNSAKYPANIGIFRGPTFAGLSEIGAIDLESKDKGSLWFQVPEANQTMAFRVNFENQASTSSCTTSPSTTTCHYQEVEVYGGETAISQGPPNGLFLRVFADDKSAPTFMVIEGRFRFTQAGAESWAGGSDGSPSFLSQVRSIYFQTVQKGNQVWGRFVFQDANGTALSYSPGGIDILGYLARAEGVCQNLGSSEFANCTDITYTDYTSMFLGETGVPLVSANPLTDDLDFSGIELPDQPGLWTIEGKVF